MTGNPADRALAGVGLRHAPGGVELPPGIEHAASASLEG